MHVTYKEREKSDHYVIYDPPKRRGSAHEPGYREESSKTQRNVWPEPLKKYQHNTENDCYVLD